MFDLRSGGALRMRGGVGFVLFAACILLAAIGDAILDDYGVSTDEGKQRSFAQTNWRYISGEDELRFRSPYKKSYGVAFELPLLLAEKALGLDDMRRVLLLRHAAGHVLFLVGALSCALLARGAAKAHAPHGVAAAPARLVVGVFGRQLLQGGEIERLDDGGRSEAAQQVLDHPLMVEPAFEGGVVKLARAP